MTEYRKGETGGAIPKRSPRVFQKADGFWYFMTREKTEVGPFPSDMDATRGVNDYAGFGEDVDRIYPDLAIEPVGDGLEEIMGLDVAAEEAVPLPAERMTDVQGIESVRHARMFSSRIFSREAEWYFFTREGRDIGPFPSREDAETALARYVGFARDVDLQIKTAYEEWEHNGKESGDEDMLSP